MRVMDPTDAVDPGEVVDPETVAENHSSTDGFLTAGPRTVDDIEHRAYSTQKVAQRQRPLQMVACFSSS